MNNLFSIFDSNLSLINLRWTTLGLILLLLPQNFWTLSSSTQRRIKLVLSNLSSEFSSLNKPLNSPGISFYLLTTFFLIAFINLFRLFPYIFRATAHPVFAISIILPLWLGQYLYSWANHPKIILAHLVPVGTPPLLVPIIVLIELVRNIIRPLTLTVRLVANISAGHLIIVLIGSLTGANLLFIISLITVISLTITLIILELGVRVIQAYVFTILLSLFLKEVNL